MAASGTLCVRCRRRPAVYLRASSGQPLCAPCLEASLERAVKRSLRGLEAFRRGVKVGVYISALDPVEGLTLSYLMAKVEAGYGGLVTVLKPSYVEVDSNALKTVSSVAESVEDVEPPFTLEGELRALDLFRLERGIAGFEASSRGLDVVAFPVSRTTITRLGLEALMEGKLSYMEELSAPSVEAGGVPVVYALRSVESEAVKALALVKGLTGASSRVKPVYLYKRVYLSVVTPERPELEYSGIASISLIASAVKRGGGRCRYCGAPADSEVCEVCRAYWLGGDERSRRTPGSPPGGR